MTSENASNSRSSGRGRYRSTTPRKLGSSSPQPSPGDVLATDLPLSESAVASSSPRKRRIKSPPPETTPTRLRQTIPMTAGAHESILGRRTRKTVTSSPSPASSFINSNGPQDTAGGPGVLSAHAVSTMNALIPKKVDPLRSPLSSRSRGLHHPFRVMVIALTRQRLMPRHARPLCLLW
jgi:hypothetical protein